MGMLGLLLQSAGTHCTTVDLLGQLKLLYQYMILNIDKGKLSAAIAANIPKTKDDPYWQFYSTLLPVNLLN